MSRLKLIFALIGHYKYVVTIVVGILIVGFLDENSFLSRMRLELQVSDLEAEIDHYKQIHEANTQQLRELRSNPDAFGKIARERYFMKSDDEDIYVLSDDNKQSAKDDETTE